MGRKKRKNVGDDEAVADADGQPQLQQPPPPPPMPPLPPVPPVPPPPPPAMNLPVPLPPPPPPLPAAPMGGVTRSIDPRDPRQRQAMVHQQRQQQQSIQANNDGTDKAGSAEGDAASAPAKSGYAMTEHSADIHDEDIYISDGSESDDEDDNEDGDGNDDGDNENGNSGDNNRQDDENGPTLMKGVNVILNNSRMGIMRRGMTMVHPSMMTNRQWSRGDVVAAGSAATAGDPHSDMLGGGGDGGEAGHGGDGEDEEAQKQRREEELAKMDPAQRAAHLLAEKQRKLEEAKINARRLTSEENAGRDPTLFSKRTSFDINFNNMDDKPWTRGNPDDYFNYGFSEEEWLEYAKLQLAIRQDLVDASRQGRMPDPAIVPVIPRVRKKPEEASTTNEEANKDGGGGDQDGSTNDQVKSEAGNTDDGTPRVVGPVLVHGKDQGTKTSTNQQQTSVGPSKISMHDDDEFVDTGEGGAWGAGAEPGSMLARLMEEQEQQEQQQQQQPQNQHHGYNTHQNQSQYHSNNGPDMNDSQYHEEHPERGDIQQHPPRGGHTNHYGSGGGHDQSNDYNNHHHQRQHQNDWNNSHTSNFQRDGPDGGQWETNDGFRTGRAGGFRGGRGGGRFGGGRGGGGGGGGGRFSDGYQGGRGGRGRGDYYNNRKRQRNDY